MPLPPYRSDLVARLWAVVEKPPKGQEQQRLRAAAALASYDPENAHWDQASPSVAEKLVAVSPAFWLEGFRPVKDKLANSLCIVFRDRREERTTQRILATSILADYAASQPDLLADLVQAADDQQFAVLFPKLQAYPQHAVAAINKTVGMTKKAEETDTATETLAK